MLPSRMFFDDLLSDMSVESKMKCDIYEKDDKYYIEMDVPGYNKNDIKIECNKGNITIHAEMEKKEEDIDEEAIKAEFKDGILKLEIPKKVEEETKKYIEIK